METVRTPPLMEIREVARTLGWSYWRTWRLMREGRLPGVIRLGRRMYVKAAVLLDWLAGRHIEEVEA
ncbi:MAG: hypothetical protein QN133_12940 [Armatimonadota bacterium]|nr:hypothetical protein [Armatimonadota bacterium]MDR7433452.1 hypothetical protein [Armatimonadota bacterium]